MTDDEARRNALADGIERFLSEPDPAEGPDREALLAVLFRRARNDCRSGNARAEVEAAIEFVLARVLMAAWEKAEGKPVNPSYVATFADMARAALAARDTDQGAGHHPRNASGRCTCGLWDCPQMARRDTDQGARDALAEAQRLVAEASTWRGFDTRDIGHAYDGQSVDELLSDLRAVLARATPEADQ
jgi:hypothetical protein